MPVGWVGEKTWDCFLDAEPMMLSVGSRTRTVSRSMNCDWVDVASHLSILAAAMLLYCILCLI